MKIKTKITLSTVSALTLGILCYSVAFPAAANDQVKTVPTKENYTVQKFVEQYKHAPQEQIDQFFAGANAPLFLSQKDSLTNCKAVF